MIELFSGHFDIDAYTSISDEVMEELINAERLHTIRVKRDDINDFSLENLNSIFQVRKDVTLAFEKNNEHILSSLPDVERVWLHLGGGYDLTQAELDEGVGHLSHLKSVKHIGFPEAKKRLDILGFAKFCDSLESLQIAGNYKNVEELISSCEQLKALRLISVKLANLECLENLSLEKFNNFGTKIADYSSLGKVQSLKVLRIIRDRKTESLEFISNLENLVIVEINEMQKVKECPKFLQNKKLRTFAAMFCPAIQENEEYIRWKEKNPSDPRDL